MAGHILNSALYGDFGKALKVHSQRLDVLANNLANADTPGFKARDIDFRAALSSAQSARGDNAALATTHSGHLGGTSDVQASLRWRIPSQPAADGNTVDSDLEQARFGEAAMRYEATLRFVDGRVKSMLTAITGQ